MAEQPRRTFVLLWKRGIKMYAQNYYPIYGQPVPDMLSTYKQPYQQITPIQQMAQIPQTQQAQPIQATNSSSDIIWVQGEAGAKGYLVAPNATVVLWDTESPTIYIKSADQSGIPSMRVLDFTERTSPQAAPKGAESHVCTCGNNFATKEQLNALQSEIDALQAKIDKIEEKPKIRANKTVKENDE